MAKPQDKSPFKLSPSKFLFGYEKCKKCFYLDIRKGLSQPGTFPSIFSKYDINGIINPTAIINEHNLNKQLIQVIDIFGRESKGFKNQPLFYIYDDGTVEKKIIIE